MTFSKAVWKLKTSGQSLPSSQPVHRVSAKAWCPTENGTRTQPTGKLLCSSPHFALFSSLPLSQAPGPARPTGGHRIFLIMVLAVGVMGCRGAPGRPAGCKHEHHGAAWRPASHTHAVFWIVARPSYRVCWPPLPPPPTQSPLQPERSIARHTPSKLATHLKSVVGFPKPSDLG